MLLQEQFKLSWWTKMHYDRKSLPSSLTVTDKNKCYQNLWNKLKPTKEKLAKVAQGHTQKAQPVFGSKPRRLLSGKKQQQQKTKKSTIWCLFKPKLSTTTWERKCCVITTAAHAGYKPYTHCNQQTHGLFPSLKPGYIIILGNRCVRNTDLKGKTERRNKTKQNKKRFQKMSKRDACLTLKQTNPKYIHVSPLHADWEYSQTLLKELKPSQSFFFFNYLTGRE